MTRTNEANVPCEKCSDLHLAKILRGGYKMPHKILDLGMVKKEQLNDLCPLCRLIAEAVYRPFGNGALASYHDTCGLCESDEADKEAEAGYFQLLAAEILPERNRDGMRHGKSATYRDTRLSLDKIHQDITFSKREHGTANQSVEEEEELKEGSFIALKIAKKRPLSDHLSYYGSIYPACDPSGGTSPARLLSPTIDWDLLQSYVQACDSQHSRCLVAKSRPQIQGFSLIDCATRELVSATLETDYVALSYVWGTPEKNTRMETPAIGDKLSKAPLVIEDAITAVKQLGYRHLWVDRFCIQQSNPDSLRDHLNKMHLVYQGALFTIIAAAGLDSSWGLPGVSTRVREYQAHANIDGHLLVSSLESFPGTLPCKWATRAWTYQEGLFSKRQLIFADSQVLFRCLESEQYEIYTVPAALSPSASMHMSSQISSIWEHIENYSKREWTYDSDALKGLTATLNSFVESSKHPVSALWGIPFAKTVAGLDHHQSVPRASTLGRSIGLLDQAHFASEMAVFGYSLAWEMSGDTPDERMTLRRRIGFPTWSWTSCIGHVRFPRLPWLAHHEPTMPDPELEVEAVDADGEFVLLRSFLSEQKREPSCYLRVKAWSVRDALTFLLAEGQVILDTGNKDHEISGSLHLDSIPNGTHEEIVKILSETDNSKKRWEAIIVWISPCPANEINSPFVLILTAAEDSKYPGTRVYERIGSVSNLGVTRIPKHRRPAESRRVQGSRPTMRWASAIIEEEEAERRRHEEIRRQFQARQDEIAAERQRYKEATAAGEEFVPKSGYAVWNDTVHSEDRLPFMKRLYEGLERAKEERQRREEELRIKGANEASLVEQTDSSPLKKVDFESPTDGSKEKPQTEATAIEDKGEEKSQGDAADPEGPPDLDAVASDVDEKKKDESSEADEGKSDSETDSDADSWDYGDFTINNAVHRGVSKELFSKMPVVRRELIIR